MARTNPIMVEITSVEQYEDIVHGTNKCLVFFGSKFCSHCTEIKPFVNQLVKKYPNIKFAHIEVTEMHIDNLDGVPVFIAYRNGEAVGKVEGANQNELVNKLNMLNVL